MHVVELIAPSPRPVPFHAVYAFEDGSSVAAVLPKLTALVESDFGGVFVYGNDEEGNACCMHCPEMSRSEMHYLSEAHLAPAFYVGGRRSIVHTAIDWALLRAKIHIGSQHSHFVL